QKSFQKQIEKRINLPGKELGREAFIFDFGKFNYNISTIKTDNINYRHRYNFKLGGQMLWGDYETSILGIVNKPIKERDIRGFINYPFFNNRILKQVTIGDIQKRSFVGGMLFGVDVTNKPPERRIDFGQTSFSTKIPAGSEYYSTGLSAVPTYFFTQTETTITSTVPLRIGYNEFKAHIYDWYGQEKSLRKYYIVPPSMIPSGELDYRISVGKLRQRNYPFYSSGDFQFGATNHITLGAGLEYLDKKNIRNKLFPYTYSTVRLFDNIFGSAEFSPFVMSQASLTWQTYDQRVVNLQYIIRAKSLSLNPRGIKNTINMNFQFPYVSNIYNLILNGVYTYNNLKDGFEESFNLKVGSAFRRFSLNYSIIKYYSLLEYEYTVVEDEENIVKTASIIAKYLDGNMNVAIQATTSSSLVLGGRYDHIANKLKAGNIGLTLPILSFLNIHIFFEKYFKDQSILAFASLNLRPSFLNSSTTAVKSSKGYSYSQRISGEIIGSTQTYDFIFQNRSTTRQGYFLTSAYLDKNNDGIKDNDEEYIKNVRFNVGRKESFGLSSTRKYDDVSHLTRGEMYRDYVFSVQTRDLEDPLWVPLYDGLGIKSEPNKLKTVEIPMVIGGIIIGSVTGTDGNPVSGILVIMQGPKKMKKTTFTNSQGEFEFPALPPGEYAININEEILKQSGLVSEPSHEIIVITGEPGKDFVTVDFMLKER
ncbi:MAG: carboxypeptidase-like regulatory domain-containing protein, partial [Bacteroidota bacterium]|nr:carboxypeptidase-like regulatory domain-containing protein [Bacteroidota bacterium]